ncbi:hypothetical protein MCUN1_003678 [Malassezia cuniculi]|uniref:Uncharacterized protein n=1 Tax=Malassezia cuniculi TaxID=948313 RepID=A0AAF0EX56_9BASI|nr:hypothetical protein MCUN1_003678 [Malassezia cuniculi]
MAEPGPSDNSPKAVNGALYLYQSDPTPLPVFETRRDLPNKLVFIPGLTDTIGVVPYLPLLANALHELGYSLVQPVTGSDLGGYGTSSLEGDAQEITNLIEHLVSHVNATGKIVLMGHSTGCQDTIAFLSRDRGVTVHGGILQAPVSDCEYFDSRKSPADEQLLAKAAELIAAGKGGEMLPRTAPAKPEAGGISGNSAAILQPAMTAYRFHSLNSHGTDDDMFSSVLSDDDIRRIWTPALNKAPILALMGAQDEFVPDGIDRAGIINRWSKILEGTPLHTKLIPGANHKVDDESAQQVLVQSVVSFIKSLC